MPSFIIELLVCILATGTACFISEKFIHRRPLTEKERLFIICNSNPCGKK